MGCVEVGIIRCWWGYVKQVAVVNLTADNMEMCLGSSGGRRESQAVWDVCSSQCATWPGRAAPDASRRSAASGCVNDPNAATIVPLVQTASTLPMMLLALPAGVLADAFDRRWMMFVIQVYFITASALLAVLTALGMMPPVLLLMFTFAVGAGQAMLSPTWQAMITELVPRSEFAAATRLDMVSVNVSRAAGPAIVRECPSWATDARAWGRLGPGRSGRAGWADGCPLVRLPALSRESPHCRNASQVRGAAVKLAKAASNLS